MPNTACVLRTAFLLMLCCLPATVAAQLSTRLERGNGPEPSTLDAHRCQEVACGNVLRDLYEGLVTEDARGRLVPGIAERWSVSADGRRWTFVLRDGLRWSNGEPLDAAQVVASFRRAFSPTTAAPFGELFDALHNARKVQAGELPSAALGVTANDARTLEFALDRSAPLPALLTLPIAFPVYLPAVARHGAEHTRPGNLVSNGAYRLTSWTPQANLVVERNPRFHGATGVAIERVRFHVTEDAAAELQRFAAGDLHLTEVVPPQPLASLRARFGDQLRISPYIGAFWLGMNLTREPLEGQPGLREALSLAVDRDILTRHVTGLGETPAFGIVPPGIAGYTPAMTIWSTSTQAQREARARALYRAAGYSVDKPLVIELRYNTSTPHRRLALAVAAMWRKVLGVQVRLRNEEWKVFVGNRKQRVITQVFRGGWIADLPDARNFLAAFGSDGPLNWTGFDDAGFRERLAKADAAASEAARNAWLHAAEVRLLQANAVVPLYFYSSKHLVSPRVRGFEANALDRHASRWLRLQDAPR
ncbi:peptide ABC transporter substrate-binding protein [Montanilutibacter psychrotolerans]|uniref:Peptide ABC transporter substrate-binding protein n=1 Tax=Montanilutibacter psychrotolerans TaxID=1327343 RepID=A0A3M8STR9_9GAMM|nr:peptide ABC transporter substrate-binding protein [Lysobacter psychrotolerans]RNF82876.1 peptide ABC transporter substrate-binding protein [Lysobacter psychrotolerans]